MRNLWLKHRARTAELMDAPDVDPGSLAHAMDHLEAINRLLNGYAPSIHGISRLLPKGTAELSLLDVGCGSGDTLRRIATWCRKNRINCKLTGIELSDISAQRALLACSSFPEIEIRHQDLFTLPGEEAYDVVHSALVLHHFSADSDAVAALRVMGEHARMGVVINDLHRHPAAYSSIWGLTRLFSRSHILQNDAPLSVARGFTRQELQHLAQEAGFSQVNIEWHWAFRWLMVARHGEVPR